MWKWNTNKEKTNYTREPKIHLIRAGRCDFDYDYLTTVTYTGFFYTAFSDKVCTVNMLNY